MQADNGHQGGILLQDKKQVAKSRKGKPPYLGQHDPPEHQDPAHTEGSGRFDLTFRHRQNCSAKHVGGIGAKGKAQCNDPGGEIVDLDIALVAHAAGNGIDQRPAAEINGQYQDQLRNAANDSGVGICGPAKHKKAGEFGAGPDHADTQTNNQGHQRHLDCHPGTGSHRTAKSVEIYHRCFLLAKWLPAIHTAGRTIFSGLNSVTD